MTVASDTLHAFAELYPEAIGFWLFFGLLPIAACALWTLRYRNQVPHAWPALCVTAACTFGYPAMLTVLLLLPATVFSIFLAPAMLDAYPTWRTAILVLLYLPQWFARQAFWLVPFVWLCWVIAAPAMFIRKQFQRASV
jgi:hypothetical protein